jgi:hypothetical protein
VPTQQMRDALLNMIVYQGDTEFASVEQQRHLFERRDAARLADVCASARPLRLFRKS